MKTNISRTLVVKNIITNITNMKSYLKYLCTVLLLLGTSAHAWGSVTYKVWNGTSYDNDGTVEIGGTLKSSDGACDFTLGVEGWCTDEVNGQVTRPSGVYKDGATCPSTTNLYLLYVAEGSSGNKYYSTKPNIYTVTYSLTGLTKDEWTYTCASDMISMPTGATVSNGNVYAYFNAESGYTLTEGDITLTYTSNGNTFTPYDKTFTDNGDGTYYYYIEGIDGDITITAVATTDCPDISGRSVTGLTLTPTWNCVANRWDATVTWNAVFGATRYAVLLQYKDGTWKNVEAASYVSAPTTTKAFTGLTQGVQYRVGVAAQCQCEDQSDNTNTPTAISSTVTPTCPTPSSLSVAASSITSTSASLTWGASGGTAGCSMTYTVTVTNHSTSAIVWSQSPASGTTSHDLTGLTSNTRYDVSMTAYNDCGNSTSKTDYYFTTEKAYINYVYTCIDLDLVKTDGGGAIMITSAAGQKVKAARTLTLTVDGASANAVVNISATDMLFYKSDGTLITSSNLTCDASGDMDEEITVAYNPTAYANESFATPTIYVSCDGNNLTFDNFITARCLPDNFVIAAKWGENWYALTADCTTSSSPTDGILLEVDDASDPTQAIVAANYTIYGMKEVASSRYAANGTNLTFVERLTADANDQKALYNGSTTSVQVYGMWRTYNAAGSPDPKYEWTPSTTDLKDYTITSAAKLGEEANARTLSLNNNNVFGTLLIDKAYSGKVRLLPATFVDPAPMQVVEWKANSVVVMYTGSGVTATTKVGSNDASSGQTLEEMKKDHGVFELTTDQALTGNTNQPLLIAITNGSSAAVGSKLVVIPAIVSGAKDPSDLVASVAAAAQTDVVVLDGGMLSALATKYTFKDITVYPGGKLVIGKTDKQLGMKSLTLRGGSSWGAAEYEYKYPQFVLNNATDGAYSNTSGVINYDYVTTKDQYYSFVLPYASNTKNIKYPLDIYGSAVSASNTGSFEFQYYDGAARAAGAAGWKVLEEDPSTGADLVVGKGYTFLGMPKKVDAYDGTDDSHANTRQRYGIHRIPMSVAANTVQAGETNSDPGKATPISVNLVSKNNDSGWNLVGNPFMAEVSGLSNTDIQVGKLVHTDTEPWDGKWRWDPETETAGQRFVVIPNNDGQSYESELASDVKLPAFKNFFVQIQNTEATSLVIPANTRTDKNLAPARYTDETEQDIRLAVDLVSEARKDKVDLLINDIYSAAFDQDGDFTKMMNTTNFNLYGVYPEDYLSFIAVDKTTAAGSIAIGYQVPAGGEYTLLLSDRAYVMTDAIEALYVTDHEVSPEVTTDLLDGPYNFTVNQAETNNTRFTVSIRLAPQTPTDIGNVPDDGMGTDNAKPMKFIYHDKLYILRNGVIYDATGKKVK